MSDKIIQLIKIEIDIANYYYQLYKEEVAQNSDNVFASIVKLLSLSIKKQNNLLSALSIEELMNYANTIKEEDIQKYIDSTNNLIDIDNIVSRMDMLCYNKVTELSAIYDNDNKTAILKKIQLDSKNIVLGEILDIQLSFIDEYLSLIGDMNIKDMLCKYKYFAIYIMGNNNEERLLERLFHTGKSIYLTSYLEASLKHIPLSYIDYNKKNYINSSSSKSIDLYKTVLLVNPGDLACYSLYSYDLLKGSILLRTDLLLLEENELALILSKMGVNKDNPWYKVFIEDRERHKTVSLGYRRKK